MWSVIWQWWLLVVEVFGKSDRIWHMCVGVKFGAIRMSDKKKFYRFVALKFYSIAEKQYFVFEQVLTTCVPLLQQIYIQYLYCRKYLKLFAEIFITSMKNLIILKIFIGYYYQFLLQCIVATIKRHSQRFLL